MTKNIDEQTKSINFNDFDKMEENFRRSVINFTIVITVFLIITGTVIIQIFMRSNFDNGYFEMGIFKAEKMTQYEMIGYGEDYVGPYFNIHIVSADEQNNTVVVEMEANAPKDNIFSDQFDNYVLMLDNPKHQSIEHYYYNPQIEITDNGDGTSKICLKYKIFTKTNEHTSFLVIKRDKNKDKDIIFATQYVNVAQ